jgi:hypothetical protein
MQNCELRVNGLFWQDFPRCACPHLLVTLVLMVLAQRFAHVMGVAGGTRARLQKVHSAPACRTTCTTCTCPVQRLGLRSRCASATTSPARAAISSPPSLAGTQVLHLR